MREKGISKLNLQPVENADARNTAIDDSRVHGPCRFAGSREFFGLHAIHECSRTEHLSHLRHDLDDALALHLDLGSLGWLDRHHELVS
jgi:hypothetical protein